MGDPRPLIFVTVLPSLFFLMASSHFSYTDCRLRIFSLEEVFCIFSLLQRNISVSCTHWKDARWALELSEQHLVTSAGGGASKGSMELCLAFRKMGISAGSFSHLPALLRVTTPALSMG